MRLEPGSGVARAERDACLREVMAAEGLKEPIRRVRLEVVKAVAVEAGIAELPGAHAEGGSGREREAAEVASVAAQPRGSAGLNPSTSSSSKAAAAGAAAVAAATAAAVCQARVVLQAPKTSTEFESVWRSFGGSPEREAAYLKLLVPEQLPAIFKSSLTPQVQACRLTDALPSCLPGTGMLMVVLSTRRFLPHSHEQPLPRWRRQTLWRIQAHTAWGC